MANWKDHAAVALGAAAMTWKLVRPARSDAFQPAGAAGGSGVSVVIPSREGRLLLERMLPAVEADLGEGEIIVVDNGSTDGTAGYLAQRHPRVRVDVHQEALSFARAANRGAALARFPRLCLLNNDMEIEPGFFRALEAAFAGDPGLFCASAQIYFPEGRRREETGRTAMRRPDALTRDDYPVYCDDPLPGEDASPVLYGSGGCSLYDREKFLHLGGFDEIYEPAYVEDLDLGYRAWLRGWPSVYVSGARVLHRHRATSSRFYTPQQLDAFLERNHARFLLRAVQSLEVFVPYYRHAISRRRTLTPAEVFAAAASRRIHARLSDREILDLTCGAVRFFPGSGPSGGRRVLVCAGASRWEPPDSNETYYLAYARPACVPPADLLAACRCVILVDGTGGAGPYCAARREACRRYRIQEIIERCPPAC